MISLVSCLMLALACLFYVFYLPVELYVGPAKTRAGYLRERKEAVYENLRDLSFEHTAGKVPDADYLTLKSSLRGALVGCGMIGRKRVAAFGDGRIAVCCDIRADRAADDQPAGRHHPDRPERSDRGPGRHHQQEQHEERAEGPDPGRHPVDR